jgi:hypothetical protein
MAGNQIPAPSKKDVCGIIMPISAVDGCSESHWGDVKEILEEAIEESGFEPNLVSSADEVSVIQKRIIQNLYDNPVVVCDISARNANVMFELGLRLAFDKATIVVKDDKTPFSFDTSPIEHLEYPRDLRFARIVEFKTKLAEKIRATHQAAADPKYTTFLKHFGEFTVAKLEKKEVSTQQFVLEELRSMRVAMERLEREPRFARTPERGPSMLITMEGRTEAEIEDACKIAAALPGVVRASISDAGLLIRMSATSSARERETLRKVLRSKYPPFADPAPTLEGKAAEVAAE